MRIRHGLPLLVFLIVIVVLSLPGCTPREFEQAEIPPEQIPEEMRAEATDYPNPIWRAHYEQDGYEIAVFSYFSGDPRSSSSHEAWAWLVFRNGQRVKAQESLPGYLAFGIGRTSSYAPPAPYNWEPQEKLTLNNKTGESTVSIWAAGYAWVRAADKVVGTTFQGQSYEGRVVNGYWILLDLDLADTNQADRFETVIVQDQRGKVLHTYQRTE